MSVCAADDQFRSKVAVLIAFGPAAAAVEGTMEHPARGIANIHGQYEVTFEFIGYIVILVCTQLFGDFLQLTKKLQTRFALTSETSLNMDKKHGDFSYGTFYTSLMTNCRKGSPTWQANILEYWNE